MCARLCVCVRRCSWSKRWTSWTPVPSISHRAHFRPAWSPKQQWSISSRSEKKRPCTPAWQWYAQKLVDNIHITTIWVWKCHEVFSYFHVYFGVPSCLKVGSPRRWKKLAAKWYGHLMKKLSPSNVLARSLLPKKQGLHQTRVFRFARLCQLTAIETHVILPNILTQTQFHNVKQSYQHGLVERWKSYRKRLSGMSLHDT